MLGKPRTRHPPFVHGRRHAAPLDCAYRQRNATTVTLRQLLTRFTLAFIGLLHALALIAMVKYSGRLFEQQQAAKARKIARAENKVRAQRRTITSAPVHECQSTVPVELR